MGCGKEDCGCAGGTAQQDAMACMAEMATPAPELKHLEPFIGEWNASVKFWMGPGEAQESRGVMRNEWMLGKRWLRQVYEGDYDFQGYGMFGYNKSERKFQGMWVDTISSAIQTDLGSYNEGSKSFDMRSSGECQSAMGPMTKRSVITINSPDKHTMEMYVQMQGQPEQKCMEIVYTRKK